jgi:HlyD family secretion protein
MRIPATTAYALLTLVGVAACAPKKSEVRTVQTVAATPQTVVVDVEATGVITPIGAVDVRSKTSGQVVAMPAQSGTKVKTGDLLIRIDPRDAQNRYDQAKAALAAARANAQVTKAQFDRNETLSKQGVITAPELESARVAYANAQSQLAAAQTQLELARISLEDVTIQAPSAGTVIATNVVPGQVIASSTNSPSGGTVLMTLANLGSVYDSTLVNESDIGKVKPGQTATVTVDAYPNRTFRGVVEKIEPRATVQQSVTMFPVKIRIENMDGALMPGMNSDVTIVIEKRDGVTAVPVDAVRSMNEATTAAVALGLDPQTVQSSMQQGGRDAGAGAPNGASNSASNGAPNSAPNGARGPGRPGAGQGSQAGGRPAFAQGGAPRAGGGKRGVVFVKKGATFEPRVVTVGLANFDVTEIVAGVQPGERVALVAAALQQQSRSEFQNRIRGMGMPGMGGGPGGGAAPRAGGARGG